jgi:hypothetical protein
MRRHLNIEISDPHFEYLDACARIRGVTMSGLVGRLLHTIAEDQLVLSVLDDSSTQNLRLGEWKHKDVRR